MPRLSIIMPVKNGGAYVTQAVRSVERQAEKDWELVIVDDHSTDGTLENLRALEREDPRVRVAENPGEGVVQAINHAYGLSAGRHLKFLDGDDLLPKAFSRHLDQILTPGATYHDAMLFEGDSAAVARLRVGRRFEELDLNESLRRLMISPPRWSWAFPREVGDRIFPLPRELPVPHEDVFLGLMFKKYSDVVHVPLPVYLYRQHPGQLYGGLFNFSREAVIRRAEAMLRIIRLIAASEIVEGFEDPDALLGPARKYYGFLAGEKLRWVRLLGSRLPPSLKARIIVMRRAPRLAARLSRRRALVPVRGRSRETGGS